MSAPKPLPDCLYGAGYLGHTWLSTYFDANGHEYLRSQCNFGHEAYRSWSQEERPGRIFTRHGMTWKEVRPSAAMIA